MARDIFAEERKLLEGKPDVEIAKQLIIDHGMGMVAWLKKPVEILWQLLRQEVEDFDKAEYIEH